MAEKKDEAVRSGQDEAEDFDVDAAFSEAVAGMSGQSAGDTGGAADDGDESKGDKPEDDGADDAADGGADDDPGDPEAKGDSDDASTGDDDEEIWKDAPPHLKALFEKEKKDARERLEKEEQRVRSMRGQLRALNRSRLSRPKAPDVGSEDTEARQKAIEEVREQYGDVVNPLLQRIDDIDSRFKALDDADQEERTAILRFESEAFLEDHPDGFDVIAKNVDTFKAWIEDQPKQIRDAMKANEAELVDADGASMVVGAFKEHLAAASSPPEKSPNLSTQARRESQRRGAQGSRSTSPPHSAEPSADANDHAATFDWAVQKLTQEQKRFS